MAHRNTLTLSRTLTHKLSISRYVTQTHTQTQTYHTRLRVRTCTYNCINAHTHILRLKLLWHCIWMFLSVYARCCHNVCIVNLRHTDDLPYRRPTFCSRTLAHNIKTTECVSGYVRYTKSHILNVSTRTYACKHAHTRTHCTWHDTFGYEWYWLYVCMYCAYLCAACYIPMPEMCHRLRSRKNTGKAVFKRPLSHTIYFLPNTGPSLRLVGFLRCVQLQPHNGARLPNMCAIRTALSMHVRRAHLHLIYWLLSATKACRA